MPAKNKQRVKRKVFFLDTASNSGVKEKNLHFWFPCQSLFFLKSDLWILVKPKFMKKNLYTLFIFKNWWQTYLFIELKENVVFIVINKIVNNNYFIAFDLHIL